MQKYNKIRRVAISSFSEHLPGHMFHITSNLNWLRYERYVEDILKHAPKNAKILDIGCGGGHVSAMLAVARKDISIIGIDSDDDLEYKEIWKDLKKFGARYRRLDALKLPFKDKSFDIVISFGVIEHTKNDNKFLKENFRVLKEGGYNFIFDLPNKYSFSEGFVGTLIGKRIHDKMYSMDQIKRLLVKNKFKDIEIRRENLIPAQIERVSKVLGNIFNRNCHLMDGLDRILLHTPLSFFAQNFMIKCRK